MANDTVLFMGQMLKRPHQVVALAPSSTALARTMAAPLKIVTGRVAELGPGTGKITHAILARGIAPADLTLFEMNPVFCDRLARAFPGVRVLNEPAQRLGEHDHDAAALDAVISGLPLLSMTEPTQAAIVGGAMAALRPGGLFVQFTYGVRPPVASRVAADLGLVWSRSRRVWANLPPAVVYSYRRAD